MVTITVGLPIPATVSLQGISVASGESNCYNAFETIYIAGSGTTFTVQNGGSATMIAGEKILYLPGTVVEAGGYMLGYITQSGQYCGSAPTAPLVAASVTEPAMLVSEKPSFKLYPNPTTGSFTLEFTDSDSAANSSAFICDIRGNKVFDLQLNGSGKQVISLENQPKGMYFIRVFTEKQSGSAKILKR